MELPQFKVTATAVGEHLHPVQTHRNVWAGRGRGRGRGQVQHTPHECTSQANEIRDLAML